MEQEETYVGIDVAKAQVDVAIRPADDRWRVSHDEAGIRQLVSPLKTLEPVMVLLEASGGLELPLVVVNPRQVRDFAKATGKLAKTYSLDAARPGSRHGNRLRRAAATRGVKKTQPGQGQLRGTDSGGAAMKWGSTDRPADQPQDGPVRDAARPGSYVGNVLGCCAREAASPQRNGRPARGETAASSTGTMPQT